MSIGAWDPSEDAAAAITLDAELLQRLLEFSRADQLERLQQSMEPGDIRRLAGLMKIDHGRWRDAAEPLPDEKLLLLIRFFALAENLPGWEAGQQSPVIPLAKVLRKRGVRLDRDLLQWLREVNDNRFLPYGPL